jgi:hypothetical protein
MFELLMRLFGFRRVGPADPGFVPIYTIGGVVVIAPADERRES